MEQFNAVGFQTYASCQGHMMWIGKGAYPYVAFAAPSTAHMRWFAQKLLADHISDSPSLYWVWEVEPSFNPRFQIVYRLTLRAPHRWWSRFFRSRLDADFASLVRLLQQLRVFSYQMDWIDLEKVPSNSKR